MSESQANVMLHIGELILDGIDVSDPARLQAAVEAELARLVAEHGLNSAGITRAAASLNAASIHIAPGAGTQTLGAQIASAVFARLRG
jgi:membrane carboxypeptidase/penicillin-binding protein